MSRSPEDVPLEGGSGEEVADEEAATPYLHESAVVETAVRLVDQAYGAAPRWWGDVTKEVRSTAEDLGLKPEMPLVRELIFAAAYVLRLAPGGQAGCELRPSVDEEHYAWPPRVADVNVDTVCLWRDIADRARHPAARARFNDLLFVRRDGPGRQRAVSAVDAYLEGAESRLDTDLDVTMFLVRAWELARRVGDWELAARVCERLVTRAETELSGRTPRAGIALSMLAAVAAKPTRKQEREAPESSEYRETVGRLLEAAFIAFQDGFQVSYVVEIMRERARDTADLEKINRREVEAYFSQAASSVGLARQSHMHEAARMARNRGFTDLARKAAAELQAIPAKDLGLQKFSWSVRLLPDQVERFLGGFTVSPDWCGGLRYFLNTGCPTGDLAALKRGVRDVAKLTPFLSATGRVLLTDEGLPRLISSEDGDRTAQMQATNARNLAELQGRLLAQGLKRMADRYGVPAEAELAILLSGGGQGDEPLALSLARGFRHYWAGDYEACVHVVVPKAEAAARALLVELDEGIYRIQAGKDPGQFPGLYILLDELEKLALDESWAYFLRWLFLGPFGVNIRNEIAHGFITDIGPVYAALVLRAASMLITAAAPQPPSAVIGSRRSSGQTADLAELPVRDRDDILGLLMHPVAAPVPNPWRTGFAGRITGFAAATLRVTAGALNLIARRLDP